MRTADVDPFSSLLATPPGQCAEQRPASLTESHARSQIGIPKVGGTNPASRVRYHNDVAVILFPKDEERKRRLWRLCVVQVKIIVHPLPRRLHILLHETMDSADSHVPQEHHVNR